MYSIQYSMHGNYKQLVCLGKDFYKKMARNNEC